LADCDGEELGSERYEVEVQLGATDPSHIIRTIEYWDKERTRYPDHNHHAVLIAEEVTSRFLNVLSLLNKSVPLIAIQMQAMEVGDHITLVFTTVVDVAAQQEPEAEEQLTTDRLYWQKKAKEGLEKAEEFFKFVHGKDRFELRYNQIYIGVNKSGNTFLAFIPRKGGLRLRVSARQSDELNKEMENCGFPVEYKKKAYVFELEPEKHAQQEPPCGVPRSLSFSPTFQTASCALRFGR
jgi:hypothetical protein